MSSRHHFTRVAFAAEVQPQDLVAAAQKFTGELAGESRLSGS
jgi:hypothetical protein